MSQLAILGGRPVRSEPFPAWPVHDEREAKAIQAVLASRNWGGYPSPNVHAKAFAEAFAAAHTARFCVPAANGTVTLEIALRAAGVTAGDEVIVTPYTWIATGAAPVYLNAVPVFADIDPETYCLDPKAVEAAITPRTKAIMPVHLGCRMADMDALMAIAAKHGLTVIEDCAHMHGARWNGRGAGSLGHLGSFSFQSSKLMTAGEGGAILTSDPMLAERCHSLVNCGRKMEGYDSFDGWMLGWNYRISEWQAAVLACQTERLEEQTILREQNAEYLYQALADVPGIRPLRRDPRITRTGNYQVILRYDPAGFGGLKRDRFADALTAEGIEVDPYFYIPLYQSPLFTVTAKDYPMIRERYGDAITNDSVSCPVAEKAAYHEALWIHHPLFMGTHRDMDQIAEAIRKIQRNASELG